MRKYSDQSRNFFPGEPVADWPGMEEARLPLALLFWEEDLPWLWLPLLAAVKRGR